MVELTKIVIKTQVNVINCKLPTKLSTEIVDKRFEILNRKRVKQAFRSYGQHIIVN